MPYIGPLPETFTMYNMATGEFGRTQSGGIPKPNEGESWLPGEWDCRKYRMQDGAPVEYTTPPPTYEEQLAAWRQSALVSRAQFATNLLKGKLLNKADAIALASGRSTPVAIARALSRLDAALQDEAEIFLMGGTEVARMWPVIIAMQAEFALDDVKVDKLFGTPPAAPVASKRTAKKG